MSFKRLSHDGYGMLERNRVFPTSMESQCELDSTDFPNGAEVGQIVAVDKANGKIKKTGDLKGLLVNSERLYDQYHMGLKNYHVEPGAMATVLFLEDGNTFTTNTVGYDDGEYTAEDANLIPALKAADSTPVYGDIDATNATIKLTATKGTSPFQVVKLTTMPDGQRAVKFITINANAL